jgi:hypothetical protein
VSALRQWAAPDFYVLLSLAKVHWPVTLWTTLLEFFSQDATIDHVNVSSIIGEVSCAIQFHALEGGPFDLDVRIADSHFNHPYFVLVTSGGTCLFCARHHHLHRPISPVPVKGQFDFIIGNLGFAREQSHAALLHTASLNAGESSPRLGYHYLAKSS